MTYDQLERIAVGLFGLQWQKQLADRLGVSKHTIQNWKRQGVAAWVPGKLLRVIECRTAEVLATREKWYEFTVGSYGTHN